MIKMPVPLLAAFIILLLQPFSVFSEDRNAEQWTELLKIKTESPEDLSAFLEEFKQSAISFEESQEVITNLINNTTGKVQLAMLFGLSGEFYMNSRQMDLASNAFFKAYTLNPSELSYLLNHSKSLLLLGELDRAVSSASRVNLYSDNWAYKNPALLVIAQAEFLKENYSDALKTLKTICGAEYTDALPQWLYIAYYAAVNNEQPEEAEKILFVLKQKYENSPEYKIIFNKMPSAGYLFWLTGTLPHASESDIAQTANESSQSGTAPTDSPTSTNTTDNSLISIQVGAFTDTDNAEEMKKVMENLGYKSVAILETTVNRRVYYKVVLENIPAEELNRYVLTLRDQGYDGYPIF